MKSIIINVQWKNIQNILTVIKIVWYCEHTVNKVWIKEKGRRQIPGFSKNQVHYNFKLGNYWLHNKTFFKKGTFKFGDPLFPV